MKGSISLVAIGCSWGGLHALQAVLGGLPATFAVPIAVVQHRGPGAHSTALVDTLGRAGPLPVSEVIDKDPIVAGVHIAPADYHLLVEPGSFALSTEERVNHCRPSADVLFETAAQAFGPGVIGVVLTGANHDGAAGLAEIARHGGDIVVQDPETAERPEMPDAAITATSGATVVGLDGIAPYLVGLCHRAHSDPATATKLVS